MRKRRDTEFACLVRNHTAHPIRLTVPFGEMVQRPKLSADEHTKLITPNRRRAARRSTLLRPNWRSSSLFLVG